LKTYLTSQHNVPENLIDYQRDILYRPEFQLAEAEPFPPEWARYYDPSLDTSGIYALNMTLLQFDMPLWYENHDRSKRLRVFYSQIVQHNVAGAERVILKKLQNRN
jgi:hypothetical protein